MRATLLTFCVFLLLATATQAADSLNVRLVGSCHTPSAGYGVAVRDSYAFVADFDSGLRVISVADPAHPTEVGHVDTPDSAVRVTVSGNYAYVVGVEAGLRVISVADPANPIEVGSYDTPGRALGATVGGDFAYLVDRDSGLLVVSIADPAHPTMVGHWNVSGSMIADIAVDGNFVYVVDYFHGLRVVSVADPASPHEVGHNDSVGFGAVGVKGGYAYVGNNSPRLSVVSLADSTHPVETGWCSAGEPAGSIAVDDYVCTIGDQRLYVVSVSDPARPDTVGHYFWWYWRAHDLATSGNYIYVASDSGFSVCQYYDAGVEEATNAELHATNCGPTVVRGVLHLEHRGPRTGGRAELLDATGRRLLDLHSGANDVSGLRPGVYFVSERPKAGVHKVIIAR